MDGILFMFVSADRADHTRHKILPGKENCDGEKNMQKISDLLFFNPFHCF